MSQEASSFGSGLSRHRLAWLPSTVGGLTLCLALGLGCGYESGGSTGSSSSGGSGGQGSGSVTSSGGVSSGSFTSGSGGSSAAGSSSSKASGGSETGGKGGGGGASSAGGAAGGGGRSTSSADTGEAGSGGSSRPGGTSGTNGGDGGTTSSKTGGTTGVGGTTGRAGTTAVGGTGGGGGTGGNTGTVPVDGKSPGCGKTSTITDYNKGNPIPITVGGQNRRYILQIPTNYDSSKPYTFILTMHALDSNDKTIYDWKFYGLQPLSNNTVIFAAPNGQKNGQPCSGTSVGDSGCGWPSGNIPLVDAVVKQVTENFCVDMNHIYATGWSYGASMSYEIGCQRPLGGPTATANWGVRAIAIYSGAQMSGNCKPSTANPVAFYESHGTNDGVLGYDGGVNLAKNWATANGCGAFSPAKASGSHVCTNATGCKTGYDTEFCSFVGGHTPFPDGGSASNTWGPAEVWKFFSKF
jgi:poly(3-hydroxybutyrate) depolymerase